ARREPRVVRRRDGYRRRDRAADAAARSFRLRDQIESRRPERYARPDLRRFLPVCPDHGGRHGVADGLPESEPGAAVKEKAWSQTPFSTIVCGGEKVSDTILVGDIGAETRTRSARIERARDRYWRDN